MSCNIARRKANLLEAREEISISSDVEMRDDNEHNEACSLHGMAIHYECYERPYIEIVR